jgi:S-adenosylmethionine:tRNA ribosyltransferase-isomerase
VRGWINSDRIGNLSSSIPLKEGRNRAAGFWAKPRLASFYTLAIQHSIMSSRLSDFDYSLPRDLVANRPLPKRDESRLMVLDRASGTVRHHRFHELPSILAPTDLLVLNDTKVLPARVFSSTGAIELLVLERLGTRTWRCLTRPGRKTRVGAIFPLADTHARVSSVNSAGERTIELDRDTDLYAFGSMPLPPYMRRASDADDVGRYQTVFATRPGAVAAPTAGLHFTEEMLGRLGHVFVTLHVGPGTFRPVEREDLSEHRMHVENFELTEVAAGAINAAHRIVAVGTTTVRVLESVCGDDGTIRAGSGSTDIFIYPPFQFRMVDALITNFHLPRSTLLMLVSAFAGREFVLEAYDEAIRERYRFYSYGDCMLIL